MRSARRIMQEGHGRRPRLTPWRCTDTAPPCEQGHPSGCTREEKGPKSYGKNIRTCLSNDTYLLKARRQLREMRHHGPFGLMTDKPSSIAVSQSLWSAHTK